MDQNDVPPEHHSRNRVRWYHRSRLASGTLIDVEYAVERDRNFLEEYFENESRHEKTPENFIYLRHGFSGSSAVTLLAKKRMVPYREVTERLPEVALFVVESNLEDSGFAVDVVGRASSLRFLPDNIDPVGSRSMHRADLKTRIAYSMGRSRYVKLRPFFETRVTAWEEDEVRNNSIERLALATGARAAMHLSRSFDVQSALLDIDGLRHVIDPGISYRVVFENNVDPTELFQYDDTETVDRFEIFTFELRNYLYTRSLKGRPAISKEAGAPPEKAPARKVLEADIEIDYYPDPSRDHAGDEWGPLRAEILVFPRPGWSVFGEGEIDVEGKSRFDEWNTGFGAPLTKDVQFYFENRYTRHLSHNLTATFQTQVSDRYQFAAQYQYDLRRSRAVNQNYALVRNYHRWAMVMAFEIDEGDDNNVSFTVRFGPREALGALTGRGYQKRDW